VSSDAACIVFALVFALFGAASAVDIPALGGANIPPALLFLPFPVLHALQARLRSREPSALSRAGLLLVLLALWGVFSAVVMPRFFAGETQVIVLDRLSGRGARAYPLHPLPTNFTQAVYVMGHLLCFVSLRTLLREPGRLLTFRNAVLLVAALDIVGAGLNLAESALRLPSLLDYVRNAAGYSQAIEYSLGGLPRIHGTFPEASLFAYFTLPLFAFCLTLWTLGAETRWSAPLSFALLCLLLLSTSATAYVGLLGYGLVYLLRELPRGRVPPSLALAATAALVALLGMYALEMDWTRSLDRFVRATLLDKADSDSGTERALWNAQAWRNFLDTRALGVGLGSGRASSFPLVLLSNLGVIGAAIFGLFTLQICRAPYREPGDCAQPELAVRKAAAEAVIAALIGSTLAIGMFDLGVLFYMFAAAASSAPAEPREQDAPLELQHA
jgi:hypothetical protein